MYTFVWFLAVLRANWRSRKERPVNHDPGDEDPDAWELFV